MAVCGTQDHLLLSAIVNASDDAILSKTLEGIITSWNPAAERMFGYTAQEIIGQPKTILFPPERLPEEEAILACLRRGIATDHFETVRVRKDGTLLDISVTISPVRDTNGRVIGASTIARDITERKQAEEQAKRLSNLQQSNDKMSALIEAIPDIIFRVNHEGICLDNLGKNKPYSLVKTDGAVGYPLRDFVPLHVGDIVQGGIEAALATGTMQSLQYQFEVDGIVRYRDTQVVKQSEDVALVVVRDVTDSKAMEQALRDSEARFQSFINQNFLLAWVTDANGVIEYFNEPYCAMIGRTAEACRGKGVFDLYPAEFAQAMLDNIRQVAQTGKTLETVESAPAPDGKQHHYLVHKFPLYDPQGRVSVGGSAIDITERKEAEAALLYNAERLREAQHLARIGSWERDLTTDTILFSEELYRLFRLDPEDGTPNLERVRSRIHPDDQEMSQRTIAAAIESGERYEFDVRLLFEDETVTWGHAVGQPIVDAQGKVIRLVGTLMDITERKQSEEAVQVAIERFRLATESGELGVWEFDILTHALTWDERMMLLYGHTPETFPGAYEAWSERLHPDDKARVEGELWEAIRGGRKYDTEFRIVLPDGMIRHIKADAVVLKLDSSTPTRMVGLNRDITERVKALQEQTKLVSLIESSSDFIAMATLDGVMLTMNPAGRRLVGLERMEEVVTTMLPDFMPIEGWAWMRQEVLPIVMRADRWEGECQLVNVATGKVHDMQASLFLIRNPVSGEPMCLATVQRDITHQKWLDTQLQHNLVLIQDQNGVLESQRQQLESANAHLETANKQLEQLATTDGLTGIKNHRAFQGRLAEECQRAQRTHCRFSLILLDVDKFKSYNDTYGHPAGDVVLRQVAQVLQATARDTDFVARYGGEEFIVLLPETGVKGSMEAAERFRMAIEAQDWQCCPVTASFGIVTTSAVTETAQQLVDMADKALYASKKTGRNCVTHANGMVVPPLLRCL